MDTAQNSIIAFQNTDQGLEYLAASSQFYKQAKNVLGLQLSLVVVIPIILSILGVLFSNFAPWAALYGLVISIIDEAFLDGSKKHLQKNGAKVQELFDCTAFQLEWNSLVAGPKLEKETILNAAHQYRKHKSVDGNWYPVVVEKPPLHLARIICQRTNVSYDMQLRRNYSLIVLLVLIVTISAIAVIGLSINFTVDRLIILVVAPILPFILWAIREWRDQADTIKRLEHIRAEVIDIWDRVIDQQADIDQFTVESRKLQDQLYTHRYQSPMIFNFIYKMFRPKSEETMNKMAEALVKEVLNTVT